MHAINAHNAAELYKRFKADNSVVHSDGETALQACQRHSSSLRDGFCRSRQTVLRTPRGTSQKDLPDAPENQQRQLREVRDETAPPRLAVRF